MADRLFENRIFTMANDTVMLHYEAPLDASGVVGTVVRGAGIASVAKSSLGNYLITLEDAYNFYLGIEIEFLKATDAEVRYQVSAEDVDGAKTINIKIFDLQSPSNAVNPVSCQMRMTIHLRNSTS